jgi:hypothetical protein
MAIPDNRSSLALDTRATDEERDIDFALDLLEVRQPLAQKRWKLRPDIYDKVQNLLGLDRVADF